MWRGTVVVRPLQPRDIFLWTHLFWPLSGTSHPGVATLRPTRSRPQDHLHCPFLPLFFRPMVRVFLFWRCSPTCLSVQLVFFREFLVAFHPAPLLGLALSFPFFSLFFLRPAIRQAVRNFRRFARPCPPLFPLCK